MAKTIGIVLIIVSIIWYVFYAFLATGLLNSTTSFQNSIAQYRGMSGQYSIFNQTQNYFTQPRCTGKGAAMRGLFGTIHCYDLMISPNDNASCNAIPGCSYMSVTNFVYNFWWNPYALLGSFGGNGTNACYGDVNKGAMNITGSPTTYCSQSSSLTNENNCTAFGCTWYDPNNIGQATQLNNQLGGDTVTLWETIKYIVSFNMDFQAPAGYSGILNFFMLAIPTLLLIIGVTISLPFW